MKISANAKHDRGQKPPFIKMEGEVFYYLAKKQPGTESKKEEVKSSAEKAQPKVKLSVVKASKEVEKAQPEPKSSTKKEVVKETKKSSQKLVKF